jgi:acyl dehydratase
MPLNPKVVGKRYKCDPFEVTMHETIYYALATNDDNDAYFDNRRPGGIIAPPMYGVRYTAEPTAKIIMDEETGLNFATVVHYCQEFTWLKTIKPGDMLTTEGVITIVEVRKKGGVLGWETESFNQKGEKVVLSKWEFFDRSAGDPNAVEAKRSSPTPGKILYTNDMQVRNGQTWIYAEPSGDHNPIHIDVDFATGVGLPGIILQGLCTMAFGAKTLIDNLSPNRDPERLKRYRVQLARMVLPGQKLTFQGFEIGKEDGGTKYGLIAKNEEGADLLRDAWCVIK